MKKFIALALTIAMIATLGVVAFADKVVGGDTGSSSFPTDNKDSQTIKLTITDKGTTNMYRIDIEWTDVDFELDASRTWNVQTHQYEYILASTKNSDVATVKVTNHSDNPVDATLTASTISGITGLKVTCPSTATPLATAVGTDFDHAPSATIDATIEADTGTIAFDNNTAGTVVEEVVTLTVTITAA